MDTIQVTLPDGAKQEVPRGTTPGEIARKISHGLAREALVARADGELIDLSRPLERDASLSILTTKDPDALQVFRHSAAHLLAAAVLELFPGREAGHRTAHRERILLRISARAAVHAGRPGNASRKRCTSSPRGILPNERKLLPKSEALELYRNWNQGFKCELVEEKAIEPMVSFYTTGKFIDFCRGPHIPSTGRIKAFKLMNVAGAYWKGQEGNPQLQRIYGGVLLHAGGTRRVSAPARRGQAARPPASGNGARSFQHSGRGRSGTDLLASQGRADPQVDGRLAARRTAAPRLSAGVHAAHHAAGFVEDQRARQFLSREYVRRAGSGESRLPAQAHELSGAHPDLQIAAAQLSRSAATGWRNWARSIATSDPACCTGCCACAASRRTMRTSSACPARSRTRSRRAWISRGR